MQKTCKKRVKTMNKSVKKQFEMLYQGFHLVVGKDIKNRLELFNVIRLVTHITDVEQPWLNRTQWNETTNQSERVKYIMNELSEENYKQLLFTRERQY